MIDQDMFANEIYLLDKGVRSCFSDILFGDEKHIKESMDFIKEMTDEKGYKIVYNELPTEEWEVEKECYEYYVCKYDHQIKVIERMNNMTDRFMIEFIKGYLLGYSPDNMEKYLIKDK